MIKKTRIFSFLLLQLVLMSCQMMNERSSDILPEAKASSFQKSENSLKKREVQNENDEAINNLVNSLEKLIKLDADPELKSVMENTLRKKVLFPKLLKACHTYSPYKVEFSKFYRTLSSKYIVKLLCTMGAYQPEYSYFLYDLKNGLEVKPLEMSAFYASGTPVKRTSVTGIDKYDSVTQELTIHYKCDSQYSCGSTAKYKFYENSFIIKEFTIERREEDGSIRYKQIYP